MRNVVSCSQRRPILWLRPIRVLNSSKKLNQAASWSSSRVSRLAGSDWQAGKSGEELFDGFQGQHVVDRVSAGAKGFQQRGPAPGYLWRARAEAAFRG